MARKEAIDYRFNLRIYWSFLKKRKLLFFSVISVVVLVEVFETVNKFLLKIAIDRSTDYASGNLSYPDFRSVLLVLLFFFISMVSFGAIFRWLRIHFLNILECRLIRDLKLKFFNHLIHLSHRFYTTHKTGALISRLLRGSGAIEDMTDLLAFNVAPLFAQLIVAGSALFYFSKIPAIIVFIIAALFIAYSVIIQRLQEQAAILANEAEDSEKAQISDFFTNVDSIKYFGKESIVKHRFANVTTKTAHAFLNRWHYYRWLDGGHSFIIGLGIIALLFVPFRQFLSGTITIGTLVFIYTVYTGLLGPLFGFSGAIRNFYRSMADFQALFQYAKIENEVKDKPSAKPIRIAHGVVEFKNVSFSYHKRHLFKNFNLRIKPMEKIAVVGYSGSGKSTLIKLLYRLYDVDGDIIIDKQDIKNIQQESLRSELSIVPQEAVLFDDTIYNNIAFSKPEATRSEVMAAMKFAQLDKVVSTFQKKEQTIVGERGVKLSGGEKQRVSIARALLADKKILILDEATSHLDSKTEHDIQMDLKKLMKGRTSIMIAHRLSTIMSADRIIVLDSGKIVQEGTHSALIKKPGTYRKLWRLQKGGYIQ